MRPITLTTSDASGGEQSTPVCPLDWRITPFQITLQANVTGVATFTVEYTSDDVYAVGYNPATGLWFPVTDMSAASADASATLISPVTAIRMRQTAGAGSVQLRVVQAGN